MGNVSIKRCKQCGKILVKKSKLGICPKCADKDKSGIALGAGGLLLAARAVKSAKEPVQLLIKAARKR